MGDHHSAQFSALRSLSLFSLLVILSVYSLIYLKLPYFIEYNVHTSIVSTWISQWFLAKKLSLFFKNNFTRINHCKFIHHKKHLKPISQLPSIYSVPGKFQHHFQCKKVHTILEKICYSVECHFTECLSVLHWPVYFLLLTISIRVSINFDGALSLSFPWHTDLFAVSLFSQNFGKLYKTRFLSVLKASTSVSLWKRSKS